MAVSCDDGSGASGVYVRSQSNACERAGIRFLEFFAANIRNPHTRRAYSRAVGEFLAWCSAAGVASATYHISVFGSPPCAAALLSSG